MSASSEASAVAAARDDTEYVTFRVADQWLGIPVVTVQEVLTAERIARVPLAPAEVAGFLNLRGQIVSAIDLRARMGLPPRDKDQRFMNVVVRDRDELFSFLVDEVGDVQTVGAEGLERPPVTLDPRWRQVCDGVVRRKTDLLVSVNAVKLLNLGDPAV
ncbi:MAG TPA: chemotaxis protein CheW [Gemmatimonadales bacterium]|nr:chemotaxis protein CheW [Gemmatimonadales bacterium]